MYMIPFHETRRKYDAILLPCICDNRIRSTGKWQ